MRVLWQVFGPVMLLIRVPNDDDDVAIKMVNDSEFGLGSSYESSAHYSPRPIAALTLSIG